MLIILDIYLVYKLKKYNIDIDKCAYVVNLENLNDMNIIKKFNRLQQHYFKLKDIINNIEKSKKKAYIIKYNKIKNKLIQTNLVVQNLLKYTRENIKSISFYFDDINEEKICNLLKFISEQAETNIFENYFLNYNTINILTSKTINDDIPNSVNSYIDNLYQNSQIDTQKSYLENIEINFIKTTTD